VHYPISGQQRPETVIAVIDQTTLNSKVTIHSLMTGIAHDWEAQAGDMLKQVTDIELPQMFSHYNLATVVPKISNTPGPVVLELTIPSYQFEGFRAKISVRTVAQGPKGDKLFDRTYLGEGETQGGKMFWGGPFGMKSAVRQSSLDAYKKVFEQMRGDLSTALDSH
jgi:hypothetical protein